MTAVARGCLPWNSVDAMRRPTYFYEGIDNKEKVIQCFNCKKDECDNCHALNYTGNKRAVRLKKTREIFLRYYLAGYSRQWICDQMKISSTTYGRYYIRFIEKEGV